MNQTQLLIALLEAEARYRRVMKVFEVKYGTQTGSQDPTLSNGIGSQAQEDNPEGQRDNSAQSGDVSGGNLY